MNIFKVEERWDRSELVIDFSLKFALVVALAASSAWLWPEHILDTPVGLIKLGDWLWAAGAFWVGMLCVVVFYFVAVEPTMSRVNDTNMGMAEAKIDGDRQEIQNVQLNRLSQDDLGGQRDIVGGVAVIKSESAGNGGSGSSLHKAGTSD
jgi:hypothetical protein